MQQTDGIILPIVRAKGIGADELGKAFGVMGFGHAFGPHLMNNDGRAGICGLPCGLATRQAAAYNMNFLFAFIRHGPEIARKCDPKQIECFRASPGGFQCES